MLFGVGYFLLNGLLITGIFCLILAMLWRSLENFFHNNYSYFDFIFIIAYFIEQLVLIILLNIEPDKITFWAGIFALLVVTTASIQKLSLDSRDRKIRELYTITSRLNEQLEEFVEDLLVENQQLNLNKDKIINYLEKNINWSKK